MTDEHALIRATGNASRAKQLLEDDTLNDAFKALEEGYLTAWRSTLIDDVAAREKLFLAINLIGKVKEHLMKVVSNGSLAKAELDEIAKVAERKKRFGFA